MSYPSLVKGLRDAVDNAAIAEAYREHGYTMKKIADYLGILERRGCEAPVSVVSRNNRIYYGLRIIDVLRNSPVVVPEQELLSVLGCG